MAGAIGKVRAVFTASTSGLTTGVAAAGSSMKRLQGDVAGLRGSLNTLTAIQGAALFGSIASAASSAARSLIAMGQASAGTIDQVSKMSARLGMTYGELAGLAHAANLSDVSLETLGNAATKLDVAFVKASQGSATAQAAFAKVGLSVQQLQGMSAAERFQAITTAIAGLPTEAERAAAAVQLFGRAGAGLLPLFAGGAEGIRQATEDAQRFGLTLTNLQGQQVEGMNDSFTRAGAAIEGIIQQTTAYLAPAIENVATTFADLVGSVGGANIGQTIGEALLAGADYIAGVADYFISGITTAWEYVSQVGSQWNAVWDYAQRAASFFAGVGDVFRGGLAAAILGVTGPLQLILTAIKEAAKLLGFESSTLDAAVAGIGGFNSSIVNSINESAASAAKNFGRAFGEGGTGNAAGEAVVGPLQTMVRQSIQEARTAAAATDVAPKATIIPETKPAAIEAAKGAQAIDSRSKEGLAEMFRLMRGDTGDVQERQLDALERIAANTDDMGEDVTEFAFGG